MSPSTRRAWIEMPLRLAICCSARASPSTRRAWIEIRARKDSSRPDPSPSTRRAWIEMEVGHEL